MSQTKEGNQFNAIEADLQSAGNMTETAKINGKSLTESERTFIEKARAQAKEYGLTQNLINVMEEDGALTVRRMGQL